MSTLATMAYRLIEQLDGEKHNYKLIPYAIAERIKVMLYTAIDWAEQRGL